MKKFLLCLLCLVAFVTHLTASELRVMTYNIHHGRGMDGKLDLARIAKVIQQHKPDIVALQEVDQNVPRSGKTDQAAVLAKLLGMKRRFGKAIDLQGGAYGLAVLSRHPIVASQVHPLPGPGEARICLQTTIQLPTGKLTIANVHLDHRSSKTRQIQIAHAEKALSQVKHPAILLGDFNATPTSPTMRFLTKHWKNIAKQNSDHKTFTCPADKPRVEIDHILWRGFKLQSATATVVNEAVASDHRPVLGVLKGVLNAG